MGPEALLEYFAGAAEENAGWIRTVDATWEGAFTANRLKRRE